MIHEKQQQKKLRRSRLLLPVMCHHSFLFIIVGGCLCFYIIIYSWNRVRIYPKKIIVSRNSTLVHFLNLAALQVSAINSVTLYIFSKPCRWNFHSLFFFFFLFSFVDLSMIVSLQNPTNKLKLKKKGKEKLGFLNSVMLPAGNQTEMRDKKGFFNSVASGSGTILRPLHDLLHRRWQLNELWAYLFRFLLVIFFIIFLTLWVFSMCWFMWDFTRESWLK